MKHWNILIITFTVSVRWFHLNHWDLQWALPIVAGLVYFAVMETWAITHHRYDRTLSERLRSWLGIEPRKWYRRYAAGAFVIFLAWFIPHIVGKGF